LKTREEYCGMESFSVEVDVDMQEIFGWKSFDYENQFKLFDPSKEHLSLNSQISRANLIGPRYVLYDKLEVEVESSFEEDVLPSLFPTFKSFVLGISEPLAQPYNIISSGATGPTMNNHIYVLAPNVNVPPEEVYFIEEISGVEKIYSGNDLDDVVSSAPF
jgi:hypothetical protein